MPIHVSKNPVNVRAVHSPRSTYKKIRESDQKMIADMTLNFDKLTINFLKQEFLKKDNSLLLCEFITLAKKHLKFWQVDLTNRENKLARYLTHLFREIDIDGNGNMEWEEFTNYIIEKATVLKNLKSKNDEIKQYIKSEVAPKIRIDGTIQKMEYICDLDKVAYFEEGSNTISFMNAETGDILSRSLVITPKKLVVNISSVKKEKNGKVCIRKKDLVLPTSIRILDMLYLSQTKYKVLLVSTSDGYVRGWKYSQNGFTVACQPDNEEEMFEHHFQSQIYCLAWDNINEVLYCGMKNGNIVMWNLKTDLEKTLADNQEVEGMDERVNMLITAMITMPKLQFMASGRMDGKLMLWDTINSRKKWVYSQHTRGILSLTFNQVMILLFSAGFDHKICIWNPYIAEIIHKIEGHLSPILTLRVVEGTSQLISMDSEGIVKITDTRRFNIISSFAVQEGNCQCFMTISKPAKQVLRLVFAGKSISLYDYDKNYNPFTADQCTVISCRYVKDMLCFFTPAGNKIKVWSALTGDIEKIYIDITSHEISCFDFDSLNKRMVIGDTKGNIGLYNIANGAKMKTLTKHAGQVTHIIATINDVDIFISCAIDNEIRISRETEESFQVVRTIFFKKDVAINCLQYCKTTKLIMVGTNVGTLAFFDLQTGKNVGSCVSDASEQYTSISKTDSNVVIATTSNGLVHLIGMPPFPNRFEKLMTFTHRDCEKEDTQLGIRLSSYNEEKRLLYVVDDKMYLTCYGFQEIIGTLEQADLAKERLQFERRSLIREIFNRTTIKLKWQMRAHCETVKGLRYIQEQGILVTTSFDKKVKIWDATSGNFIDSLQQNYNKGLPEPLGYYDFKKKVLYREDRKVVAEGVVVDPNVLEGDPFAMLPYQQLFSTTVSNHEWKLYVNFKDVLQKQKSQFAQVVAQLSQSQSVDLTAVSNAKQEIAKRKLQIIERNRVIMRELRGEGSMEPEKALLKEKQFAEERQRKISKNYFRRSMMKCIENIVEKSQDGLARGNLKTGGKNKHADYVPIYKTVSKKERSKEEILQHCQFIEELSKRETENIINNHRHKEVSLSREETQAANKLFFMLQSNRPRDNSVKFMSKENSQVPLTKRIGKSAFFAVRPRDNGRPKLD